MTLLLMQLILPSCHQQHKAAVLHAKVASFQKLGVPSHAATALFNPFSRFHEHARLDPKVPWFMKAKARNDYTAMGPS